MFFFLSKVLHILVMPLTWIVFFWLLYAWKRKHKLRKLFLFLAIFFSVFFTNTVIFKEFARLWEVQGTNVGQVQNHDVAIILGGMFEYNHDLETLSIRRGGDRIWQALRLYHRGKVRKFLISGAHGFLSDRGLNEAKQLRSELLVWGIPKEAILIDSLSKNTYQNAVESRRLINALNLQESRFILVTSALHMKRSKACFIKQGIPVTPYSTDLFTGPKRAYHWDEYLIPSISTTDDWSTLTHEWIGYLTYKVVGYL
jgi:uncharacterized SAM-binding protein YcdF (DUF218 family)